MSVLIVTSLGDMVVDLHTEKCPLTSKNFLKLCKVKYYNGCLFHTVQKDFTAQTGDPTGTGSGGDSIYKFLYGDQARFFSDEINHDLKHSKTGTVAMASAGENLNASQFYFTLRDDLDYLDGKHTVFGEVAEGLETLARINEAYVDGKGRPYKNIRVKHTYILDDPFDDPPQLADLIPDASPERKPKDEVDDDARLEDDWVPLDEQIGAAELEELLRSKEAHSRAVVLESIGDIPDAEIRPPDNVLFVCKLNPVTEDEDLHTIFSRFGVVLSAEIIRDFKTGDSLCYAFIEFETREACEQAYFKMDNALIDDRRIHVDFSQSVAKLWSQYRRKDHLRGNGCFKCGAPDHIANDCTGGPMANQQPRKYVLKDGDRQHGGGNNSSYEMVFDGDASESSRQGRRHRGHDPDDRVDKQKMSGRSLDDSRHRDQKQRDSSDRHRQSDRSRGYRGDEWRQDNKESQHGRSRSNRDYHEDQSREKRKGTQRDQDEDKEDEHDYKKRTGENGRHAERRDSMEYRKGTNSDRVVERSNDRDYRKRNTDDDNREHKRNDRDYRNRYKDGDGDHRDKRDESVHRKIRADDDEGHEDKREERECRRRVIGRGDDDRDPDRRHWAEKRR